LSKKEKMKTAASYLALLMLCCGFVVEIVQFGDRNIKFKNFQRGETYEYVCHYGIINAGRAVVKMDKQLYDLDKKICYRVDVEGKTVGLFSIGMKVNDLWRSFIDTSEIVPWKSYRNIEENKYKLEETAYFNHKNQTVRVIAKEGEKKKDSVFQVKPFVQDIISGYYYLRTLNFEELKPGDVIEIPAFFEDKSYDFKIRYIGISNASTKFGKVKSYEMAPIMPDNQMFAGENSIRFWVTADQNRVPVKVRASMFIGAVEVDLVKFSGTKEPIQKIK
jgi:hypothetical protein